jgi:hypothetical protein
MCSNRVLDAEARGFSLRTFLAKQLIGKFSSFALKKYEEAELQATHYRSVLKAVLATDVNGH